jgi:hypothetical protein
MKQHLYDQFRKHGVAPDQLAETATIGEKIALRMWADAVFLTTGHIFV